jgi:Icc-related predicted phosphoesterase
MVKNNCLGKAGRNQRRSALPSQQETTMLTLVLMSDTHGLHDEVTVPPGDILLHAGDFTEVGGFEEVERFNDFLGRLPHPHKIIIAGNHDMCFEDEPERARRLITNAIYLQDQAVEVEGIKFYGSPWQPWFFDWAFNLPRGIDLERKWAMIPENTDVLITHGPPHGIGDANWLGEKVGCQDLRERLRQVRPRLHVFGHIHEARGMWEIDATTFVNASTVGSAASPPTFRWR